MAESIEAVRAKCSAAKQNLARQYELWAYTWPITLDYDEWETNKPHERTCLDLYVKAVEEYKDARAELDKLNEQQGQVCQP